MEKNRIQNEIEYGKGIVEDALNIWGWGTPAGQIRAIEELSISFNLAI
jgi:hypothetical protein